MKEQNTAKRGKANAAKAKDRTLGTSTVRALRPRK